MRNRKIQRQVKMLQKMGMLAPRKPKNEQNCQSGQSRPQVVEKPWLNPEGYRDDTAYRAIQNVMRERGSSGHTPRRTAAGMA